MKIANLVCLMLSASAVAANAADNGTEPSTARTREAPTNAASQPRMEEVVVTAPARPVMEEIVLSAPKPAALVKDDLVIKAPKPEIVLLALDESDDDASTSR